MTAAPRWGILLGMPPLERPTVEVYALSADQLAAGSPADSPVGHLAGGESVASTAVPSPPSSLDVCFEARRAGARVGIAGARVLAGRTALLWGPWLAPREPADTPRALVGRIDQSMQSRGVLLIQALIDSSEDRPAAQLRACGFDHAADLLYAVATITPADGSGPRGDPSGLEFAPRAGDEPERLASLVQATYEGTLDCPALDGARDTADILDGYRNTGTHRAEHWLYARHAGRDVGCLLLAEHREQRQGELVYMGLVPSARGNGWGRRIALYARRLAATAGWERLVLAVDAANRPAVAMYEAAGFTFFGRQSVFLKFLVNRRPRE
jgi:mycothiol synthase